MTFRGRGASETVFEYKLKNHVAYLICALYRHVNIATHTPTAQTVDNFGVIKK